MNTNTTKYKQNKIYFTEFLGNDYYDHYKIKKKAIVPCIRKTSESSGNVVWHTNYKDKVLDYSWTDAEFLISFGIPFELKPKMKVKLKSLEACSHVSSRGLTHCILQDQEKYFGGIVDVKIADYMFWTNGDCFSTAEGFIYLKEWIEEVVEAVVEVPKEGLLADTYDAWLDPKMYCIGTKEAYVCTGGKGIYIKCETNPLSDNSKWKFKSDKINWNLLSKDLLEDNIPLALISEESCPGSTSDTKYYIIGIQDDTFDWAYIFKNHIKSTDEYLSHEHYDIFRVNNLTECKNLVKDFTQRYKSSHKRKRAKAIKRAKSLSRTKEFKVFTE